ncbi:MAG: 1-acyl-sn-glycerol-3-phosphate acyltransferase [Bacteroides sp.]|nr:1-acyl-sn-glycerol-3-phosphate acyltransferase [Bacteroides sp.]MDD2645630.1 1-acyl-sn-glycerol-3-phosphate acyltransferase [Bacteroides sp.]MDD4054347.1 1-acyl-sn-glycerol-3-phosphate acyltransferase [Bacteroides sp.]MDD4720192.1 1-acyl-sn-glycerol-3-phosphate acyltransferase [Bacteroides sp.]NLI64465.1 acyltransferase [Bacteroidales bacterium]
MKKTTEFDEIRPYYDDELPEVFEQLIEDPAFQKATSFVAPGIPFDMLAEKIRACKTKLDFQKAFAYGILERIADDYTDGISIDLSANSLDTAYTYISNHRDIILDAGFLSVLLVENGLDTVEIAIGDNLLVYPWIKRLVRINKSFIVQRALTMRQMLESSARMSRYMHHTIKDKKQSIWIAQREGRAKDSDDRTQDSVLKMFAMGGEGTVLSRLKNINIVPLSISYEYDPCDFLKAQEFQLKRDNPSYAKTTKDDLQNMEVGLFGYKGRVHFKTTPCINQKLDELDASLPKNELFQTISKLIDQQIHQNYKIYPVNYIANDMLSDSNNFTTHYTEEEKHNFSIYLDKQIGKIKIDNKDESFLRHKMLLMYANPLINYLKATGCTE